MLEPHRFGSRCAELLDGDRPCDLGPGTPNQMVRETLSGLDTCTLLDDRPVSDPQMAACCLSGLWLLHDFLEQSHSISQRIGTTSGSYWHGIMHRREPDFSNAKYWFRRVGDHPVFEPLASRARELVGQYPADDHATFLGARSDWDPFAFIDLCQATIEGRSTSDQLCRQIARAEWELLFDYCYHEAIGR